MRRTPFAAPAGVLTLLLAAAMLPAQILPGRFIVELKTAPLGELSRNKTSAQAVTRMAALAAEQATMRRTLESRGAVIRATTQHVMNAMIVELPGATLSELAAMPGVTAVYPVRKMKRKLDHALPIHNVPQAWDRIGGMGKAGAGIKIGIVDTGISIDHPAFQDAALKAPVGFPISDTAANLKFTNSKVIVARSYEAFYPDEFDGPDTVADHFGHGTAVSMTAAGAMVKGPLATISGVAPKAWIGVYKDSPLLDGSSNDAADLKAFDDCLSDGMDVINYSAGFFPSTLPDLYWTVTDRLTRFGVLVVVAAGNEGDTVGLNSIGSPATAPDVIAVGATANDRVLSGAVDVTGIPTIVALPAFDTKPVSGPIADAATLDPTGLACAALPGGSLAGKVVLILRGTCTFELKANNAMAAGAVAAVIYSSAALPGAVSPSLGAATLPTVEISNADGLKIKDAIKSGSATANVRFSGYAAPANPNMLTSFSSRGPNVDFNVKPDLVATGGNVYMATQKLDPLGGMYDPSGYIVSDGTSFSSPIVAGAVAVLKSARPGLTAGQYRSLIVNSAGPLVRPNGMPERVMQSGSGVLDVAAAVSSPIAVFPTSLSFGVTNGTLDTVNVEFPLPLTISNVGKVVDTFSITGVGYEGVRAVSFGTDLFDVAPASTLAVTLNPGQSKTVYLNWITSRLPGGEYQGMVRITSQKTGSLAWIPYWQGVQAAAPTNAVVLFEPPASDPVGSNEIFFLQITDAIGIPFVDPALVKVTVVEGGGRVLGVVPDQVFGSPNILEVGVRLGTALGQNTFRITIGNLKPIDIVVQGTR